MILKKYKIIDEKGEAVQILSNFSRKKSRIYDRFQFMDKF